MDALNHLRPTARETIALRRHWALRRAIVFLPFAGLFFAGIARLIPEGHTAVLIAFAVIMSLAIVAPLVYVSFLLRCPRCNGWIGLGSSMCLGCGLKTAEPAAPHPPDHR